MIVQLAGSNQAISDAGDKVRQIIVQFRQRPNLQRPNGPAHAALALARPSAAVRQFADQ